MANDELTRDTDPIVLLEELAHMVEVGDTGLTQLGEDYVMALRWAISRVSQDTVDAHV